MGSRRGGHDVAAKQQKQYICIYIYMYIYINVYINIYVYIYINIYNKYVFVD